MLGKFRRTLLRFVEGDWVVFTPIFGGLTFGIAIVSLVCPPKDYKKVQECSPTVTLYHVKDNDEIVEACFKDRKLKDHSYICSQTQWTCEDYR